MYVYILHILYIGLNPDWEREGHGLGLFIWVEGGMRRKEFDTNILFRRVLVHQMDPFLKFILLKVVQYKAKMTTLSHN